MKGKKEKRGDPVRCECGKLVAIERQGRIYVMCKNCKRQVEVARIEPRAVSREPSEKE